MNQGGRVLSGKFSGDEVRATLQCDGETAIRHLNRYFSDG